MFFNTKQSGSKKSGFTLIETLISTSIGFIVFAALGSFFMYSGRSMVTISNYNDLNSFSRNALDTLSRDIRQANQVKDFVKAGTKQTLTLSDENWKDLVFDYDSSTRLLTRKWDTEPASTLLKECDELKFELYQRNTKPGTYDQYDASTSNFPETAKLVQVSWVCSRTLLRFKVHTESVQTAKIVIRK
jgi:type II secretory pathway pseudopilin PulG